MTCPHCQCQTYMNPCPQCGENTNRPNYSGYSRSAQRRVAIESLERWEAQMHDLIDSEVFGEHQPDACARCRASRLLDAMANLRHAVWLQRSPANATPGAEVKP